MTRGPPQFPKLIHTLHCDLWPRRFFAPSVLRAAEQPPVQSVRSTPRLLFSSITKDFERRLRFHHQARTNSMTTHSATHVRLTATQMLKFNDAPKKIHYTSHFPFCNVNAVPSCKRL
jgi:hypothetical protein